jgi:hypothetical protein
MKNKSIPYTKCIQITVFVIICLGNSLFSQDIAFLEKNTHKISGIDNVLMSQECLPGWILRNEKIKWIFGREGLYSRKDDSCSLIFITLGVHFTVEKAFETAHEYMGDVSPYYKKGTENFTNLGDSAWFCMPGTNPIDATNILFIRDNVLIILGRIGNRNDIFDLAKRIDEGILKRATFVKSDTLFSPPKIISIDYEEDILSKLNSFKIIINAVDSYGSSLDFRFAPGVRMIKTEKNNEFIYISTPTQSNSSRVVQAIRAIAINQFNAISEIKELDFEDTKK